MNITGNFFVLKTQDPELKEVTDLDFTHFPNPWSKNDWLELDWNHHFLFAWKISGQIKGFALFSHVSNDDTAHLLKLFIDFEYRGKGEVQLFWKKCLEDLKAVQVRSIYLEVETANIRAITFYKKCGFETLRTIKGFYSNGLDATTMHMIM